MEQVSVYKHTLAHLIIAGTITVARSASNWSRAPSLDISCIKSPTRNHNTSYSHGYIHSNHISVVIKIISFLRNPLRHNIVNKIAYTHVHIYIYVIIIFIAHCGSICNEKTIIYETQSIGMGDEALTYVAYHEHL